ncbi:MAG: 30S ribosome-binding factor RbfA [Patescibacteria group bacterium]|nr:30S ribosome-binding factor RbfA [Patescibacteria group bacterium]
MASFRIAQINETIKNELGPILLQEIEESPLGLLTITKVETSPDMRQSTVWVSFLENKDHTYKTNIEKHLGRAAGHIRQQLSKRLTMKRLPKLHFKIDHSGEYAGNIDRLVQQIKRETE